MTVVTSRMRRITQYKRIRIGTVGHGYSLLKRRSATVTAAVGPDWSFWIPVLGIALFVSPLLGSAVASSFPEIGPRPLTTKEAFAAVTPLKLQLESLPSSISEDAVSSNTLATAALAALPPSRTTATRTSTHGSSVEAPYALDVREIAAEAAAEHRVTAPQGAAAANGNWRYGAMRDAFSKIGTPYVWGGEQPGGFDCSGFVKYVMARQGISLPRTAREMRETSRPVATSDLKPGDLIFFRNPDHVGIFIGGNTFVHASSGRGRVTTSALDGGYYSQRYAGSGRVAE